MAKEIIIIGAGFAGVLAALSAARLRDEKGVSPADLKITVVAPESALVIRPRLYERDPASMAAPLDELFAATDILFCAGRVEAIDADYTRTAVLKGLPGRVVLIRHVLPNALMPTITVAATQLGYIVGGLVVVETLFHYEGIGSLIYNAAMAKDFPMLEAGVLVVGVVYMVANLVADALIVTLDPRLRLGGTP